MKCETNAGWNVVMVATLLGLAILASGCGTAFFSAKTETCYEAGDTKFCYTSSKNQENLIAKVSFYPDRTLKELNVETTATTAESAIAAAAAGMATMAEILRKSIEEFLPLAKAAAMSGS